VRGWRRSSGSNSPRQDRCLYNRFRYYEPGIGRYISADPIGQLAGVNLHTYAGNSPTNFIDPLGLIIDIKGTPAEQAATRAALSKLKTEPGMKKMIEDLEASPNTHSIRPPSPGEAPHNSTTGIRANESNGIGTGSETVCDPTKPVAGFSPESVLGHERKHASDKDKGIIDRSVDPATGNKRSEDRAMDAANAYRRAVGEPERTSY
jgi:RHS repeat-associated protein